MKYSILDKVSLRDKWMWPNYDAATFQRQKVENGLFDAIVPFLKKKRLMVQAGGNCGMAIEPFALKFNNVYTFEPDPLNFYCLKYNLPYANVFAFQAALGNSHKMVSLQHGRNSRNQWEVGAVHVKNQSAKNTTPVLKIDDFDFPYCDLIQLDTEGYELQAILGGYNTIKTYKPVLCIEWFDKWAMRYGNTLKQMESLLEKLGYKLKATYLSDRIYAI